MVHDGNGTVPHANALNDEIKEYLDCRGTSTMIQLPLHVQSLEPAFNAPRFPIYLYASSHTSTPTTT
ncbi:hypothetical protein JHK86_001494 [Glycine max]|nr:hypothetical protein JHK86_001494 [Glycine max]